MRLLALAALCCAAHLSPAAARAASAADAADSPWVSARATALQEIPERSDLPTLYRAPDVAGRTVRQIVHPSLDVSVARLHFSNRYGRAPLVLGEVRIARSASAVKAETFPGTRLTFRSQPTDGMKSSLDAALRDPGAPAQLQTRYDSGDHIHPSDAGYAAMADAVPRDAMHLTKHP